MRPFLAEWKPQMDDLWQAIASIATSLHQDRIEAIASAIQPISAPNDFDGCLSAFGPTANPGAAKALREAWLSCPRVTGREIASGLRAAASTASVLEGAERVDLVWTGPRTGLIPTRNTEQVILEVIDDAQTSLFIVSYVFYNAASIVAGLNKAAGRGVVVRILLETATKDGGVVTLDGISTMQTAVPDAELYIWNPSDKAKSAGSYSAAVHAKCAVADHRIAFITSANLTSAAMERNMELGLLVRGGTTPSRLHSHLEAMITTGVALSYSDWTGGS